MKKIISTIALLAAMIITTTAAFGQAVIINVANPASGTGYSVENGVITITQSGTYTLQGTTTSNRVVVAQGVAAIITLDNVSITSSIASPFELNANGANVTLKLVGNNSVICAITEDIGQYSAGLQVEGSAKVTIEGSGNLTVRGGIGAAGIGNAYVGGSTPASGSIIINSGNLTTTGGYYGAGIGGTYGTSGGNIVINGGDVTATGGDGAAGIGSGYDGTSSTVTISGGTVTATGGGGAAGIGGGRGATSATIRISGGAVTATGGGEGGAGIGSGQQGNTVISTTISISDGIVCAYGTAYGAGIGGGGEVSAGSISISGGTVIAFTNVAAAIGAGILSDNDPGNINITGGTIIANRIGVTMDYDWNDFFTPLQITGASTVVIANRVNGDNFGNTAVVTGANLTENATRVIAASFPKSSGDTVRVEIPGDNIYIYDTIQLPPETLTLVVHDTLVVRDTLHDTLAILVIDGQTGMETIVEDEIKIVDRGDDMFFFRGLASDLPFAVYDSRGALIYRGTDNPVKITDRGVFILVQDGKYWKFVR